MTRKNIHPSVFPLHLYDEAEGGEHGGRRGEVDRNSGDERSAMGFMCPGRRWLGRRWHWISLSQSPDWICGPALPGPRPGPALNLHRWLEDAHGQILALHQKSRHRSSLSSAADSSTFPEVQWECSHNKSRRAHG